MRPVAIYQDPPCMPHTCIKCGAHAQIREWFIDTGTDVDWEGIVYFCNSCFADMVKCTPEFLSVEAHREIVAEYQASMEELANIKQSMRVIRELWFKLTGLDLTLFFQNLKEVDELERRMEFSRDVLGAAGNISAAISYSAEPEPDNSSSNEPESSTQPIIAFS